MMPHATVGSVRESMKGESVGEDRARVRGELNRMGFCRTDVSSVMGKLEDTNIESGRGNLK